MATNVRTAITLHRLVDLLKEQANSGTSTEPYTRAGLAMAAHLSYSRTTAIISEHPDIFNDTGVGITWTGKEPPNPNDFTKQRKTEARLKRQIEAIDTQREQLAILRNMAISLDRLANAEHKDKPVENVNTSVDKSPRNKLTINVPGGLIKRLTVIIDKRSMWDKIDPRVTPIKATSALDMLCLLLAVKRYFEDDAEVAKADVLLKRLEANS